MGEVLCVTQGSAKQLAHWVRAQEDRYVVWVGLDKPSPHPRIYPTPDNGLAFQQLVAQLLYLPFVYADPSHPALQRLARIQTEFHYRAADFADQGVKLLTNYQSHLQSTTKLALDCRGKFRHISAVVCGAGPSLQETIPFLREHRDHFLVVGCGAGMQALLAAGIEPHLAVHVDPDPYHQFPSAAVPLFYQLRTSHEVASLMRGARFLMEGSGEFPLERWIEDKLGLDAPSDGGWTAATRAVALMTTLGCPKVFLAGMDFAASSTVYAKGVDALPGASFMTTQLQDGSTVKTRPDWLLAAEWLRMWVMNHPQTLWAVASKPSPLLASIPCVDLQAHLEPGAVSEFCQQVFDSCKDVSRPEVGRDISQKWGECSTLVDQFLSQFQAVFPASPSSDEPCMKILEKMDRQELVKKAIDPIWNYWEAVFKRQPGAHPDALIIHRALLVKSLADRFYV